MKDIAREGNRIKDTEEVALPPIEHVEADADIVEVDLAPDPVHPPSSPRRPAPQLASSRSGRSGRLSDCWRLERGRGRWTFS